MTNTKKLFFHIFFGGVLVVAASVYAADYGKIPNPLGPGANSLNSFFDGIVSIVIQLGTIVAALGIMYGGFLYVTAQGNEEQLSKATKTIIWAFVGAAILLGARAIMSAIKGTVTDLSKGV